MKEGNWMSVAAEDLTVLESGWYSSNQRIGDMKYDEKYKNFKVTDIFEGSTQV